MATFSSKSLFSRGIPADAAEDRNSCHEQGADAGEEDERAPQARRPGDAADRRRPDEEADVADDGDAGDRRGRAESASQPEQRRNRERKAASCEEDPGN